MVDNVSVRVYDIIVEKILENIRDLGEITLRPQYFAKPTIENRLGRANCTVGWARLLYDKEITTGELLPKMADTLAFLHDIVQNEKYGDGEILIRSTLLYRIVKPAVYFINFPKDAIPIIELFIRENM